MNELNLKQRSLDDFPEDQKEEATLQEERSILNSRKAALEAVSWMYERAYRQQRLDLPLTISFETLDDYCQKWADITEAPNFPWVGEWPTL